MPGFLSELEDSASERFYRELEAGRFMTTSCPGCGYAFFPPRMVCPRCLGEDLEWIELPGKGRLYAFTQQHYGMFHLKPEVVGVVDLEGCEGRILSVIDAPFEELKLDAPVEVSFFQTPPGGTMHGFKPVT